MDEFNGKFLISLITPTYNAMQYIEKAFESIKNQTIGFENIEWIIVDDCSDDDTPALLRSWAQKYPNIRLLSTGTNTGTPAGPRNLALNSASAPFIMFIDNDDAFLPNACKALYDEIIRSGADIVTGDVALMDRQSFSKDERKGLLNYSTGIGLGERELSLPLGKWIEPYLNNHWCKIYRREIIEANNIRCLSGELWEDILFLFEYMCCCKRMVHISEPILEYRIRRESLSHAIDRRFICSMSKSICYGMHAMEQLSRQKAEIFAALLVARNELEAIVDYLLGDETMSREDLSECLLAWKPCFILNKEYNSPLHSAYAKILEDDFCDNCDEKALFHFFTLKKLFKERKTEINNILGSNTFKLAKKLSDAKEKLFGGKKA